MSLAHPPWRGVSWIHGLLPNQSMKGATVTVDTERIIVSVTGLACGGGGATTVERSLRRIAGVRRATVDPWRERAVVEIDPRLVHPSQLAAAIRRVGYGVSEPSRRVPSRTSP